MTYVDAQPAPTQHRARLLDVLPRGGMLTPDEWHLRHRFVCAIVAAHVPVLFLSALRHFSVRHALIDAGAIAVPLLGACWRKVPARVRSLLGSVALVVASAVLVHITDGAIESHFHFFIVLGLVALYQDWIPFAGAIAFTAVQHAVMGVLAPGSVFSHAAGQANPILWAIVHAVAVLAASAVMVANWRINENAQQQALRAVNGEREKEMLFKLLVQSLDQIVWMLSPDGRRILYVNGAFEHIYGRPTPAPGSEIDHTYPYVAEKDRAALQAVFANIADGTQRADIEIVRPDGTTRSLAMHTVPVTGLDGQVVSVAAIATDVTDRHRAETETRRREAAEAANTAKSEFLSRISHELRTPLNAILGFGQLLERSVTVAGDVKKVGHILTGGRHLLSLVDDVLDVSRIESGNMKLACAPMALGTALREAADLVSPIASTTGVTVQLPEGGQDLDVEADPVRLRQVLVNLMNNAVKFNKPGGKVFVGWTADAGRAFITVEDTGIGIPAADLDRLFQPFDRLGADQAGIPGTGLGLALSRSLVEAMGGRIDVTSSSDGTVFTVELPCASVMAVSA